MEQSEIRELTKEVRDKISRARLELDTHIGRLRAIQTQCRHPKAYETSCMGDRGTHCPDCGYST